MLKTPSQTRVSETQIRYRTRIEDTIESRPGTSDARRRLHFLFQTFADSPDLLNCGPAVPERLSITHSGRSWVVEAEAIVDEH